MYPENIKEALEGQEVIVYFDEDGEISESFIVKKEVSKEEIAKAVNDLYGERGWVDYSIY